ncbi:hypothetical protein O3299_19835 [Janthinobacterium sp. SUN176]|uniref:hypothetical protein n=1 Tax=Janthinobacterium sp. SUN176 TaxID=3014788 RepID=UPI002713DA00|nr:hypothetical protein [Janthinobacterium sp. SUN176]MDO8073790.1 hypothetical protein [Janthinobacterium sp. SUN176]
MLNSDEAKAQQKKLRAALEQFREAIITLGSSSDTLHMARSVNAVTAITAVDEVVNSLADAPQFFSKAIRKFWSQESKMRANSVYDEALKKAAKADDDSLATLLGISTSALYGALLSEALLSALGVSTVKSLALTLARPALSMGISSAVAASLAGTLGSGLAARAVMAPTTAIPVVGQVIGLGLLAYSAWSLYNTSQKNAKIAEDAASACAEVSEYTAKLTLQGQYVVHLQEQTSEVIKAINKDLRKLLRKNEATNYRMMAEENQDLLAGIINNVLTLSALMTKTADDAIAEAAGEAEREAAEA